MPRHRGMAIAHILKTPRFAPGSGLRERFLARLGPESREILERGVLASSWYDEAITAEVLDVLTEVLELHTDDAIKSYFRQRQAEVYSRVFKAIVSMLPTRAVIGRAGWFWRQVHDTGDLVIDDLTDHSALARTIGNPHVTTRAYRLAIAGTMEAVVALSGGMPVTVSCEPLGPEEVRYHMRWGSSTPRRSA